MTDLSVVILAKNEKLHIKRCSERLAPLEARQIFVVDLQDKQDWNYPIDFLVLKMVEYACCL